MNELDKKIRQALREEDAELFEEMGVEPGVFEMLIEPFRGKHWWLTVLSFFWTLVFFVLCIGSGVQFFRAVAIRRASGCGVGVRPRSRSPGS